MYEQYLASPSSASQSDETLSTTSTTPRRSSNETFVDVALTQLENALKPHERSNNSGAQRPSSSLLPSSPAPSGTNSSSTTRSSSNLSRVGVGSEQLVSSSTTVGGPVEPTSAGTQRLLIDDAASPASVGATAGRSQQQERREPAPGLPPRAVPQHHAEVGGLSKNGQVVFAATARKDEASLLQRVVEEQRTIIFQLTKTCEDLRVELAGRDAAAKEMRKQLDTADQRLLAAQSAWDSERDRLQVQHLKQQEAMLAMLTTHASSHTSLPLLPTAAAAQLGHQTTDGRGDQSAPPPPSANIEETRVLEVVRDGGRRQSSPSHLTSPSMMEEGHQQQAPHARHDKTSIEAPFSHSRTRIVSPDRSHENLSAVDVLGRRAHNNSQTTAHPYHAPPSFGAASSGTTAARRECEVQTLPETQSQSSQTPPVLVATERDSSSGVVISRQQRQSGQPLYLPAAAGDAYRHNASVVVGDGGGHRSEEFYDPHYVYASSVQSSSQRHHPHRHYDVADRDHRSHPAASHPPPLWEQQHQQYRQAQMSPSSAGSWASHQQGNTSLPHHTPPSRFLTSSDATVGLSSGAPVAHATYTSRSAAPLQPGDLWSLKYVSLSSREVGNRVGHLVDRLYGLN